jgi:outer membrane protein assembly factor BamE
MLCAACLAAGCAADSSLNRYVPNIITPYRMDIQQGNFVTQDMVDKLQVGQTREQVRFILGTPLLTDIFHAARWDYIFRFAKGWNDPEKHLLTVYFENDKLARWEANVPPPKSDTPESLARAQAGAEKPGFLKRLFSWGKTSEPAAAPAAAPAPATAASPATVASADTAPPTAATPPAPTEAPVAGAANLSAAGTEPPKAVESSPPAPTPAPTPVQAQPANIIAPQPPPPEPEKTPGIMNRLFGWMKSSGGSADAAAAASRAASPDPEPHPTAQVPPPPSPAPAAAPTPATSPAVAVGEPTPMASASPPAAAAPPAPSEPPPAAATAPPAAASAMTPAPLPAAPVTPAPPALEPAALAPAPGAPAAAQVPADEPAPPAASAAPQQILGALEVWRAAWESRDPARYLAAYAPDFKVGPGQTRAKWEAQRRERLEKPAFIAVKVVDPKVTMGKGEGAVAVFVQEYESDLLKESGRKTLKFGLYGGKWLIREESLVAQGAAVIPGLAPMVAAPGAPIPAK